jgi:hypothetical protein
VRPVQVLLNIEDQTLIEMRGPFYIGKMEEFITVPGFVVNQIVQLFVCDWSTLCW